ncbi:MAG: stage III sporulation protein AB [Lachnospiraceae bacterium]|jgi:stage III sporulation protein AB
MLKLTGTVIIIGASTAIGCLLSVQLSNRQRELKQLLKLVSFLEREITYGMATLPEALEHTGHKMASPFSDFLFSAAQKAKRREGKTFDRIFEESLEEELKETSLTAKDKEGLKELGKYLGYLDVTMQKNMIQLYQKELEMTLLEIGETITTKKKLYQSLGIMCGLFLAVALY